MTALYRNYAADELEDQYVLSLKFDDVGALLSRWKALNADFLGRVSAERDLAYGPSDGERLDLFRPAGPNAPVLVFIHGGYWTWLDKDIYAFALEPLVAAGALVANLNYTLCPNITMDDLVDQVRRACAWLWRHAGEYGGDPNRITVTGHSAGGHLTAMMAATDWPAFEDGLPRDLVKSAVPVSGLMDLEPLRLSSLNEHVRMSPETARKNSPQFSRPTTALPVSVVVGAGETEEFKRQSQEFTEVWRDAAGSIEYLETPGHHMAAIESMTLPGNLLTTTLLRHLGL